ncbi:hypothetical protein LEN26_010934 [Aphanomyces euteiches]|nr:hypothetical protein LEN26_010934 [Aphanomyces euteiches]KAH9186167.1 hypothetical protein AeNC1_011859 [Aphanomyces euteiches]
MARPKSMLWHQQFMRLLACVAAMFVMLIEFKGSQANMRFLFGEITPTKESSIYQCTYVPRLLPAMVPDSLDRELMATLFDSTSSSNMVYLDSDMETEQLVSQNNSCSMPTTNDYLYDSFYLNTILNAAFARYGGWNASDSWIIVDCSFENRLIEDTTMIKFFLLDKAQTKITTFVLQTMTVSRPRTHEQLSSGLATWTHTTLKSLKLTNEGDVTWTEAAEFFFAVGFEIPFEENDFVPVELESLVPRGETWIGRLDTMKEEFEFVATSGMFRRSPTIQAYMDVFYWDLPPNPIEFMSTVRFKSRLKNKDVWGWFRWLLCDGIGLNIAFNFVVGLIAMVNIYLHQRILWIPDVYASLQNRATIRAGLLLFDCIVNHWWYPYQWAINQGIDRSATDSLAFTDNARADGLMVVLAFSNITANLFRVRVQLAVIFAIFVVCFYLRQSLTMSYGILSADIPYFIGKYFEANIARSGRNAMDLWGSYENFETDFLLNANECTYLIIATGVSVAYVVITKLWISRVPISARIYSLLPLQPKHVHPVLCINVSPQRGTNTRSSWDARSTLYDELNDLDVENTSIERSSGVALDKIYGFVAPFDNFEFKNTDIFVTPCGVWMLGFVIVNNQYVVEINDVIYLLINSFLGQTYFEVYGFVLQNDMVSKRKHRIFA